MTTNDNTPEHDADPIGTDMKRAHGELMAIAASVRGAMEMVNEETPPVCAISIMSTGVAQQDQLIVYSPVEGGSGGRNQAKLIASRLRMAAATIDGRAARGDYD